MNGTFEKMAEIINGREQRSAWRRGVTAYALELLEELKEGVDGGYISADDLNTPADFSRALLSGASDWSAYSYDGCSLIYNGDIAVRLCCPSELKKTREGERRPNSREEWLDVQARALAQAARVVRMAYQKAIKK
jgi:hypothetical protein|nr:MAG TPA: hypothetical protein [Caudoviricetes sp.]